LVNPIKDDEQADAPSPAAPPLQFDKATADATELKAGYDKMVVDAVEHRAQVGVARQHGM
jgi:hypothetical protein